MLLAFEGCVGGALKSCRVFVTHDTCRGQEMGRNGVTRVDLGLTRANIKIG